MMRVLLISLLLVGCGPCGKVLEPGGPAAVAIVDDLGPPRLQADDGDGGWRTLTTLPDEARAFRFSSNLRHLAWIQDVTHEGSTSMQAWVLRAGDESPSLVGELGLRRIEAPGLAVANDGQVAWVDAQGVLRFGDEEVGPGRSPSFVQDELVWISTQTNCLMRGRKSLTLCDPALEVLDAAGDTLVVADKKAVTVLRNQERKVVPVAEAVSAAVSSEGRLALVRHNHEGATTMDELVVVDGTEVRSFGTSPVIVSIAWEPGGALLAVKRSTRRDLYELMLAHAPEEFGGEQLSGTAMRVDPETRAQTRVPGLKRDVVRTVRVRR